MAAKKTSARKASSTPAAGTDKQVKSVGGAGESVDGAQQRVEDANAKMIWGDGEPEGREDAASEEPKTAKAAPVPAKSALMPREEKPPKYDAESNADVRKLQEDAKASK